MPVRVACTLLAIPPLTAGLFVGWMLLQYMDHVLRTRWEFWPDRVVVRGRMPVTRRADARTWRWKRVAREFALADVSLAAGRTAVVLTTSDADGPRHYFLQDAPMRRLSEWLESVTPNG